LILFLFYKKDLRNSL